MSDEVEAAIKTLRNAHLFALGGSMDAVDRHERQLDEAEATLRSTIESLTERAERAEAFCREFIWCEENPHELKLLDEQMRDLRAASERDAAIVEAAKAAIGRLMDAMRLWGAEEDGIPNDSTTGAWAAYVHAKCLLCPSRLDYKCSEYDEQYASICEPCAACGKIRKHNFASFFMQSADGKMVVVCGDVCARRFAALATSPDTALSPVGETVCPACGSDDPKVNRGIEKYPYAMPCPHPFHRETDGS